MSNITPQQSTQEIWKDVVGFEGWYQVSSHGRIKRIMPGRGAVAGKILSATRTDGNGYPSVFLHKDENGTKVRKEIKVHHLVAQKFLLPKPTPTHQINHKNGIKLDNRVENLEWMTNGENMIHSWKAGLRSYYGEGNHTSKLTESDVHEIIASKGKVRQKDLALRYGVHLSQIKSIHRGITWKHITQRPEVLRELTAAPRYTDRSHYERRPNAKLTSRQVAEIKRFFPTHANKILAQMYGVTIDCIYHIRIGKTWRDVTP